VECYENLKGKGLSGAVVVNPFSTATTYQLIPKAAVDKLPVFSMGYGMAAAADGRWFPWVFNFPTTYWSQASAVIRYIGQKEGGLDKLTGKKIIHIFHNSAYGREANSTLEDLARRYGFELTLCSRWRSVRRPADHPHREPCYPLVQWIEGYYPRAYLRDSHDAIQEELLELPTTGLSAYDPHRTFGSLPKGQLD